MFRKLLDMAKSTNFQKLKRDSEINLKKASFYTKKAGDEVKSKIQSWKIPEKFPGVINYLKDARKKLNIDKLDNLKSNKIDEWNYKFEEKVKSTLNGLKKLMVKSKEVPKQTANLSKSFGHEVKTYFSESYTQGVAHVKKYLKANEKYFAQKKKDYGDSFRKKKNNILIVAAGFVFIYAVGANIPHAIMNYKLAKDNLKYIEERNIENNLKESSEISKKEDKVPNESGSSSVELRNPDSEKSEPKA